MLYNKGDSSQYIQEFKKRFTNFCEKCPLLISFTTTPNGVQVIDETSNDVYEISWDFAIPVKSFIHGIKNMLIDKGCYPIIYKIEEGEESVSHEEQLQMAIDGESLDSIPVRRYKKHMTRLLIDKCVIFKDIFILKDLDTNKVFRYKLNKSSVFFLKKMRSGKLTQEEAGKYFFEHATFLNNIISKEEGE
jgi:hypothetical protein